MNQIAFMTDGRARIIDIEPDVDKIALDLEELRTFVRMYNALLGENKLMHELVGSKKIYTGVL